MQAYREQVGIHIHYGLAMGLLIKGGEIVTAESRFRGDISSKAKPSRRIGREPRLPRRGPR